MKKFYIVCKNDLHKICFKLNMKNPKSDCCSINNKYYT